MQQFLLSSENASTQMHCFAVACLDDEVQCPNFDNYCKPKEEYILCTGGRFYGQCLEANAACDDIDACVSEDMAYYCSV